MDCFVQRLMTKFSRGTLVAQAEHEQKTKFEEKHGPVDPHFSYLRRDIDSERVECKSIDFTLKVGLD